MDQLTDVTYDVDHGLAWITINRPERYNSFRARTVDELVACFKRAWSSDEVGVICLTGAPSSSRGGGADGLAPSRQSRQRRRPRAWLCRARGHARPSPGTPGPGSTSTSVCADRTGP